MRENILSKINKEDVNLSIINIIIDSQRIGNEGLQFLCLQKVSHVILLYLGKTIDIKNRIK
jgi:hypothetical protein